MDKPQLVRDRCGRIRDAATGTLVQQDPQTMIGLDDMTLNELRAIRDGDPQLLDHRAVHRVLFAARRKLDPQIEQIGDCRRLLEAAEQAFLGADPQRFGNA